MWSLFNNDWTLVYATVGNWNIKDTNILYEVTYNKKCWYEIWYSPSRNKHKIKMGGHNPKEHKLYSELVERMNRSMDNKNPGKKTKTKTKTI